jgi:hypothetical protein
MRGPHRSGSRARRLGRGLAPLAWVLVPALAQAQAFSPGNIATTPLPAMAESGAPAAEGAPPGRTGTARNLLPGLFDEFAAYGELSERFTDNATGSAINPQSDFDTQLGLGFNAASTTAHFNAALAYSGYADYFARHSHDLLVSNSLNANALAELVPDHVLLSAQAFASPIYVSRLGNTGPAGEALAPGANSDLQNFYGFMVRPDFTFRLGDFLRSDLLPSYSASYFDRQSGAAPPPPGFGAASNYATRAVTERISSGDYFARLQWGLIGNYSQMGQSAGGLTQRSAMGELAYAIDHGISLVADGGYQSVKSDFAFRDILNGPIILGGLRFDLARLNGEFRVGEQYHSFSAVGHLTYQITPRISLAADAQDNVTAPGANLLTPDALLGGLLQGIASGQIQIPASGISLGNLINAVGLQNSIARFKTDTLSLSYAFEETTFTASAFNTEQRTETPLLAGQNGDLRTTGFGANIDRQFSQDLRGSINASYRDDSLLVGRAKYFEIGAIAEYSLTGADQLYLQGDYYHRLSDRTLAAFSAESGSVSAASIRLGLRHTF